jgi:Kef-type K+ transport system membrane component KefB
MTRSAIVHLSVAIAGCLLTAWGVKDTIQSVDSGPLQIGVGAFVTVVAGAKLLANTEVARRIGRTRAIPVLGGLFFLGIGLSIIANAVREEVSDALLAVYAVIAAWLIGFGAVILASVRHLR